ncbi:MAG TPA: hypothetical protein VN605_11075 [Thermoanaerobaculia bacterium]|nr:hypothetical protein [Thermoanaerobaculia bacterium]
MMNFEIAVLKMPDGSERKLTTVEFMAMPLGERIQLLTGSKIKFYRKGEQISPIEAIRRTTP